MTITLILVLSGLLALLFLIRLARGRSSAFEGAGAEHIQPVDVEAFRNLIDPEEAEFLRANLSRTDFRMIQRQRLTTAVEYIFCVARNATVLIRMGEGARHNPDPSIAEAGENLMNTAIRLRIYAFQAIAKLYWGIIFPGASVPSVGLAESYERMTGLVLLLGRMQTAPRNASSAL